MRRCTEYRSPLPLGRCHESLIDAGIPVFVLTGNALEDEPYISTPPVLGHLMKPTEESKIDYAVKRFLDYKKKQGKEKDA